MKPLLPTFSRILVPLKGIIGKAVLRVMNWYEAARVATTSRGWVPEFMRDARADINSMDRWQLQRISRYFAKNNAWYNKLCDLFELYLVGQNVPVAPDSSDKEWNDKARPRWNQWASSCMTDGGSLANALSLAAQAWFVDGEVYAVMTPTAVMVGSRTVIMPKIELIEAHRLGTPGTSGPPGSPETGPDSFIADGIEFDRATGRKTAFFFSIGDEANNFKRIRAERVAPLFKPVRIAQPRGIPFASCVLNDIHDLHELQIFEMKAAKDAARVSNVIETETGELPETNDMARQRFAVRKQNSDGTETTQTREEYIQRRIGGETVALRKGETLKQNVSTRPSVAAQWYWEWLTSKICCGIGISKMLVLPWSIQGTVARGVLDGDALFFKAHFAILAQFIGRIYGWWADWAIRFYPELSTTEADLPDYRASRCRPPRAPNVDVGRNSAALLAELAAGATTLDEIYSPKGEDWRDAIDQRADEVLYIHQAGKARSVGGIVIQPSEISSQIGAALLQSAQSDAASEPQPKGKETELA